MFLLQLNDGGAIRIDGLPPQGTRHSVLRGVDTQTGRRVVVKLERIAGALDNERRALEWVNRQAGPAPALRRASTDSEGNGSARFVLVLDPAAGVIPHSREAWARMGTTLAGLSTLPWSGSGLPVVDAAALLSAHRARMADLGVAYPDGPADGWSPQLMLTHGDPGPGNFLDSYPGTLIDWENAQVAPVGLDFGRAVFIALLGVGPEGFVDEDRSGRALAVGRAYRAGVPSWRPSPTELRWWLIVAAVQIAHARWERRGERGVPSSAAALETLSAALAEPWTWTP